MELRFKKLYALGAGPCDMCGCDHDVVGRLAQVPVNPKTINERLDACDRDGKWISCREASPKQDALSNYEDDLPSPSNELEWIECDVREASTVGWEPSAWDEDGGDDEWPDEQEPVERMEEPADEYVSWRTSLAEDQRGASATLCKDCWSSIFLSESGLPRMEVAQRLLKDRIAELQALDNRVQDITDHEPEELADAVRNFRTSDWDGSGCTFCGEIEDSEEGESLNKKPPVSDCLCCYCRESIGTIEGVFDLVHKRHWQLYGMASRLEDLCISVDREVARTRDSGCSDPFEIPF